MSVTLITSEERALFLLQIERLVNHPVLHGSQSLCKLLRYLAQHALNHPKQSVKEYKIATEVFGRSDDFDPHLDATIRVQAGRLRTKLIQYYATDGNVDPVVVDLPKGSYTLSFFIRHIETPPVSEQPDSGVFQLGKPRQAQSVQQLWFAIITLSALLLISITLGIIFYPERKASSGSPPKVADPELATLASFWRPFLSGTEEPWVIFSNASFVGRPDKGMRFFDASKDSPQHILVHYTGVGEVLAVHNLDRVFDKLQKKLRVKRGGLFTLDDAKNNDLIFVGSPAENLTLLEIPTTHEFVFQRLTSGPRKGDLAIVNVSPREGEPQLLLPNSPDPPLSEDYAIIALVRGLNPARSTLILAGTTTIGTEAAVEYVCEGDTVQELLQRLGVSSLSESSSFEAIIKVEVKQEVPVRSVLIATRKLSM